jgi:hypothetical protein
MLQADSERLRVGSELVVRRDHWQNPSPHILLYAFRALSDGVTWRLFTVGSYGSKLPNNRLSKSRM